VQDARQLRTAALAASGRSGKAHEVRNLSRWVAAIAAAVTGNATPTVARALRESVATGVIDGFVVAYRGFPSVLKAVAEDGRAVQDALPLLDRVGDRQQALAAGFATTAPFEGTLSKREAEVYELLAAGRTNRAIAEALFISEVTVKVHVRHILQKLGAKTRTEAVALGATTRPQ
jgi:DNA-binding NarL/FixJ family response regulator